MYRQGVSVIQNRWKQKDINGRIVGDFFLYIFRFFKVFCSESNKLFEVVVQSLNPVTPMDSLWFQGLQHARLPCPSLSPGVCSNSCPLSWWCHPTISSSVTWGHWFKWGNWGTEDQGEGSWAPRTPLPAWPKLEQSGQSSPVMPPFGFIPDPWLRAWGCKWLSHDNRVQSPSLSFSTKKQQKETSGGEKKRSAGPHMCGGDIEDAWHGQGVILTICRGREPALSWTTADSRLQASPHCSCQLRGRGGPCRETCAPEIAAYP